MLGECNLSLPTLPNQEIGVLSEELHDGISTSSDRVSHLPLEVCVGVRSTSSWKSDLDILLTFINANNRKLSKHVLKEHQMLAVHSIMSLFFSTNEKFAYLADDMGLGKTTTSVICAWFLILLECKVIIICPPSLIDTWRETFSYWVDSYLSYPIVCSSEKLKSEDTISRFTSNPLQVAHTLIASYKTFERSYKDIRPTQRTFLIVDEVHLQARKSSTLLHKGIREFKAEFKLCLSGTPVVSGPNDVYNIFEMMTNRSCINNTNVLGNQTAFNNRIKTLKEILISTTRDKKEVVPDFNTVASDLHDRLQPLKDIISKYMIRRKFNELEAVSFPSPKIYELFFSASQKQSEALEILLETSNQVDLGTTVNARGICNIGILNDSNNPIQSMSDEHINAIIKDAPKLTFIYELLQGLKLSSLKIVIISEYTETLYCLQKVCTILHIKNDIIVGDDDSKERSTKVREFASWNASEKCFCFLLSKTAGGVGLDFTAASYLLLVEPSFEPAMDHQAMARINRIGQTKQIYIFRLVMKGEVDDVILQVGLKSKKNVYIDRFMYMYMYVWYKVLFTSHMVTNVGLGYSL